MTNTKKEFSDWLLKEHQLKFDEAKYCVDWIGDAKDAWQSCQQLNDRRIADLLAVIKAKDEALSCIAEYRVFEVEMAETAQDALKLQPNDVELVAVGYIGTESMEVFLTMGMPISPETCDEPVDKLYIIKEKA